MDKAKLRRIMVLMHLCAAAFMAPVFILVAISGGLYLTGNKGAVQTQSVALPANASLDFKSPTLESDVRSLLSSANIDHKFEYIRNRGSRIELRPTSRTYLEFKQTDAGLTAARHVPNFQKSMMELHKGHGPSAFKTYQKVAALLLFLVILGGVLVGLLSKVYRNKTVGMLAFGSVVFLFLALFA